VLATHEAEPVSPPTRDSVAGLDTEPTIVSISDIHGYLGDARSALLTLTDHPEYPPLVRADAARRLHWAGDDEYVLVFNGDLIDRGAHNAEVIRLVERLMDQAPPGHVRVTLGNHEMGTLCPDRFTWDGWYSVEKTDEERNAFMQQILDGHVVAAYEGYNVTFAHAGAPQPYSANAVNEECIEGVTSLLDAVGTADDIDAQYNLLDAYPAVFGVDGRTGRGPKAGLLWLDFEHIPETAPPQVVGHTRHDEPTQKGRVVCQNIIRNNRRRDGGEGIIVETPDELVALCRDASGGVVTHEFDLAVKAPDE